MQGSGTNGFPYYWLWQNPTESQFIPAPTYGSLPLDYDNACTKQFVTDVCKYWLKQFKLDGFRFDQVTGFDNPKFPQKGAPELVADLKQYAKDQNLSNVSFILEDTWDYQVIQDSNTTQPTGAWFDQFRSAKLGLRVLAEINLLEPSMPMACSFSFILGGVVDALLGSG